MQGSSMKHLSEAFLRGFSARLSKEAPQGAFSKRHFVRLLSKALQESSQRRLLCEAPGISASPSVSGGLRGKL